MSKNTIDELTKNEKLPDVEEATIEAVSAKKEADAHVDGDKYVKYNKDGTPRKKRVSRVGKLKIDGELKDEKIKIENENSAIFFSTIIENLQITSFGEEFVYSDDERLANRMAWASTLDYYGGVNVPPPVALVVDQAAIIMRRTQMPQTKSRLAKLKTWIKSKFKKRVKKNAHANSGQDNERQDDVRNQKSE